MKGIITLMFCAVLLLSNFGYSKSDPEWWQSMSLYQIYPRSFKDSDGDGIGDLKGIMSKLEHLTESNVDAFWLSPIYPSPMVDFGYDISDFVNIDTTYGTMEDFEALTKATHDASMKIIMDFVPNHSSDQHEWFEKSLQSIEPYTNYYVWHEGKVLPNGTVTVPNNWVSVFGGSAWTWREERQAYYLHQFAYQQPDLNYENENVVNAMKDVMRFWLDKGVDGFRVDAIPHLCEDVRFLDEPLTGNPNPDDYGYTHKIYTKDQLRTYEMVKGWREVLNEYSDQKVLMMEAYANMTMTMKYYVYGAHFPFNFAFITDTDRDSKATDFKRLIDRWMVNMPVLRATANWVAGNHDNSRLVTRYGRQRAEAVTMITLLLPGVGVTYNGEEIGMEDTWISWEDTKDPQGCNAGKDGYEKASRDPVRTPFQWDDTTSAGFSTNSTTWLPVNKNYVTLNLAAQKKQDSSYYALYKAVAALRKWPAVKSGALTTRLLDDDVLAFTRKIDGEQSVYVVVNFANKEKTVDLSVLVDTSNELSVYYATTNAHHLIGNVIKDVRNLKIPASGAVIYISAM
ncbi:PREDICTED: alpha-glucosidase-like isoform X2 [Wasmannia auropunctata]|nr:PREDICTED: alpha-glucosidase-like isoform X2 [Wasmannia auropunctata]XP_011702148.1 PREDICTED: alpha-glucosidase-like isoform X2 [Wasmannia auropunctata]